MPKQCISLIAAMSRNRVIGKDNELPWDMPNDLQYFLDKTKGKTVIMGRKTFESIGKPLPKRRNIIVTRDKRYTADCEIVYSLEEAISLAKNDSNEIMVIGGQTLYEQALPLADRIYITIIDTQIEGDTFFPEWDETEWKETHRAEHKADEKHAYDYCFLTLERK